MVKLVNTIDLKSINHCDFVSSSLTTPTKCLIGETGSTRMP